jgi:hypothetical protein
MDDIKISTKNISRKTLYNPIKIALLISLGTVLLYYICPQEWNNRDNIKLLIFLLICNAMLFMGYNLGILLKKPPVDSQTETRNSITATKFLRICTKAYLVMFLPDFFYTTRIIGSSFGEI